MADDLVTFLRARLDEDEALARATYVAQTAYDGPSNTTTNSVANARHIIRHDPARVLREVEAERAIVARYEYACLQADHPWHSAAERAAWEKIAGALELCVVDLTAAYVDHPDNRSEEWRVRER